MNTEREPEEGVGPPFPDPRDPRAALADVLLKRRPYGDNPGIWSEKIAGWLADDLAKRGVLLVPADVVQAIADYPWGLHLAGTPNEQEAIGLIERLRAALSDTS